MVVIWTHGTLRIPLGKPVVVGGMTLEPGEGLSDGKQLYLIVEATAND